MASSSVTLYHGDTENRVYALTQTSANKTEFRVAGLALAEPQMLTIERKIQPGNSKSNDQIIVTVSQVSRNTTSGLLATGKVSVNISVPRDNSIITQTVMSQLCKQIGSLFGNNCAALSADAATSALALLGGSDL